jgi:Zn-finger nucleic acid-binding protein
MVYRDVRWSCPRDGAALEVVRVGIHSFMRCPSCRGAFLEAAVVRAMVHAMGGEAPEPRPVATERPLRCPSCSQPLARGSLPSAPGRVEIDACAEHGVWFDRGELESVLERAGLDALAATRR